MLVAGVGTINPSSGSASIFVPLEHAVLSGAAAAAERTRAFARYSLVGALAGAVGSLAAGTPDWLAPHVPTITALKLMFVAYALLGVLGGIAYHRIASGTAARAAGRRGARTVAARRLQARGAV